MERFSLTIHHPRPTIHLFEMAKAKLKTIYSCQSCGHQTSKWLGKCPDCNSWNSFVEEIKVKDEVSEIPFFEFKTEDAIALTDVTLDHYQRIPTHLPELDRVLGSGIVPGSLILLGGDPGIGKSTLVLQALNKLAESGVTVLYATGEESREQIKMRANRLNIHASIYVVAENSIERILNQVQKIKPQVLVVDSIQTVYLQNLESAPGSISQVRECAGKLLYLSKTQNIATLLIGHVTKEGALAGPRVLEHMVDTVLYFEGDSRQQCRILRSIKNRFGSTN